MIKYILGLLVGIVVGGALCVNAHASEDKIELIQYAQQMEVKYQLPDGLLRSICEQETRWRNVAGSHGEIGVCQIKPDTVAHICPECRDYALHTTFHIGSRGDIVKHIQAELSKGNFYEGQIDGIFGPKTYKAVKLYQSGTALNVDGVVGRLTWSSLFSGEPFPGETIESHLWNPKENIEWAAKYLDWLGQNFSARPAILMAMYNGGPGNPVVTYMLSVERRLEAIQ